MEATSNHVLDALRESGVLKKGQNGIAHGVSKRNKKRSRVVHVVIFDKRPTKSDGLATRGGHNQAVCLGHFRVEKKGGYTRNAITICPPENWRNFTKKKQSPSPRKVKNGGSTHQLANPQKGKV